MSPAATFPLPIHELLAKRTGPHSFDSRAVTSKDLTALFEAARWSASAGNEQAWSYIVATREEHEEFEWMLSCVAEVNLPRSQPRVHAGHRLCPASSPPWRWSVSNCRT